MEDQTTFSVRNFGDSGIILYGGDNRHVLADMPSNSIDSVVTDGPYALVSIVKRFGKEGAAPARGNEAFMRASKGFMGKTWDNGEVVNSVAFWAEILRVLKPGGHLISFGGTRTYHRMACAVEDAGFEVRDMIQWLYGTGFPKSHNVSLAIDKAAGAEREVIGTRELQGKARVMKGGNFNGGYDGKDVTAEYNITAPATVEATRWQGWGTALKPANEPIVLARKPLSEKTVAANVLKWGTGAINIDGCRVQHVTVEGGSLALNPHLRSSINGGNGGKIFPTETDRRVVVPNVDGRFPANVTHDGSDEVVSAFPSDNKKASGVVKISAGGQNRIESVALHRGMNTAGRVNIGVRDHGDSGSAARFFYSAKASKKDRAGSKHPTVKPVSLMRYLCRLVTPPGGTVLDPFAGSGTTGEAARLEGFDAILIEREAEYLHDIERRLGATVELPKALAS